MAAIVNARDVILQAAGTRVAGVTLAPNLVVDPSQVTGLGLLMSSSKLAFLEASSQVFQIPKSGSVAPASITLVAKLQNITGTPSLSVISGTMSSTPVLSGNTVTIPYANFTSDSVTIRLSITESSITYTDDITIVKVREGIDGLTGLLTNEAHTVPADNSGNVLNYAGAGGTFKVYSGTVDVTTLCTFSIVGNASGVTTSIGATTGVYSVTAAVPTGTDVVTVVYRATFGSTTVDKVFTLTKSKTGAAGTNGTPGVNVALVTIYQRSASTPSVPSATATYTFATGGITGLNNGWSATIPAGSNPLYVTTATASSSGTTDTIATGEWASPVVLAQDGATGANGINSATVYLFQRTSSSSSPSLPSASVTYTFNTGVATGVNNGWTQTLPTSGGSFRWVTTASALSTGSTDTISSGEWAAASLLAQDGANGSNGAAGQRGSRTFYVTLSGSTATWSDTLATTTASVDGGPVLNDTVVQSNSSQGFSQTKFWNGTSWLTVNAVVDGNLLVSGTVGAAAFVSNLMQSDNVLTRGLSVRDGSGNIVLASGTAVDWSKLPGSLDSAVSTVFVVRGTAAVDGTTITKPSGSGWDSDAYSVQSYTGGAFASATAGQNNKAFMFGLNTDPTTDSSYTSIDYAIYCQNDGNLNVYESGSNGPGYGTYVTGDMFSVQYDGSKVVYYKNGVAFRTISVAAGLKLYFDSSLYHAGTTVKNVAFGPYGNPSAVQPSNPITGSNVTTYISGAAIKDAQIENLSAAKVVASSLSAITATIGTLRTASSGARTEIKDNIIEVYDSSNVLRVKIGVF